MRKTYLVENHQRGKPGGINLAGEVFGRLTAIQKVGVRYRSILWQCRCTCGAVVEVTSSALRNGSSTSCGCYAREVSSRVHLKHGFIAAKNPLITKACDALKGAIGRCHNPSNAAFKNYGARGISVCQRWRDSKENFIADMGLPPTAKHTLERCDNSKGYSPDNCRWATYAEQSRNKRTNRMYEIDGESKCLADWCREYNIPYNTVRNRLLRANMSIFEALTKDRNNKC